MNYIKRICSVAAFLCLAVIVAGCSKEYQVRLYNFYDSPIEVVRPSLGIVDKAKSLLLYDSVNEENVLLPAVVKIRFGDNTSCYYLWEISTGGYAQYGESGDLVVRLKLDKDKKIYAYDVRAGFNKNNAAGPQPERYPANPQPCDQT